MILGQSVKPAGAHPAEKSKELLGQSVGVPNPVCKSQDVNTRPVKVLGAYPVTQSTNGDCRRKGSAGGNGCSSQLETDSPLDSGTGTAKGLCVCVCSSL